jgi:transcriptional regulator with XRE-family HTH domain
MASVHRLRELREEQGLSQRALAELAKVAPATILRAEKGLRVPYGVTVRKLAKALGVEPVVLIRCGPSETREGAA